MNDVMQKIEAVVEEKVRTALRSHGGDLKVEGRVHALIYQESRREKGGLLSRLLGG